MISGSYHPYRLIKLWWERDQVFFKSKICFEYSIVLTVTTCVYIWKPLKISFCFTVFTNHFKDGKECESPIPLSSAAGM